MYELKHKPSITGIRFGDFNFRPLEEIACGRFVECPKLVTLARHTDLEDKSLIHCYGWRTKKRSDFQVPRQKLLTRYSPDGRRFVLVQVISEHGLVYWLVVCESSRYGFLVHGHVINRFGNVVSLRRRRPRSRRPAFPRKSLR